MSQLNKNPLKRFSLIITVIIVILAIVFSSFIYLNLPSYEGKIESIDVAYSPFESVTLFWIAENQKFFSKNGLNVTSHKYDTGAASLDAVLNSEADIAVGATEFPLVLRALNQLEIQTVGSISKSEFIYLVVRADRGIENASDLIGKRVGSTFGTIAHYFMGRFLSINGIDIQDITLVDLKTPAEWLNAIVDGDVDAIATAQPYANLIQDSLGSNAVVWSIQNSQPLYAQAISTNEWITNHPEVVRRFLKSLLQAEEYANNQPAEAKAIVKKQMNFTETYIETVWRQNQFGLTLDQSLIIAMEGQARWMINNNLTNERAIPDFLDYIYVDGLVSVKPDSVNIIR